MDHKMIRLGPTDTDVMRQVNALFHAAFESDPAYTAAPPSADYLAKTLASPDVIALAALHQSAVVGGLVAYILPKLEQARSEIYIYDIAVAETHRRAGIATALITEVRHIATDVGAWVVYVQADQDDPPAETLYTKLGTREAVLHFDLTPLART